MARNELMLPHWLIEILSQQLVADAYTWCDKAACAFLSLRYVPRIQTIWIYVTDRSNKILSQRQWFSHVTQGDLLQQPVAAMCRSDLSYRVSRPLVSVMLACFNIQLSRICTVAYEVDFRPKISAHILQYMDFFAYSHGRAILMDGKQLHCHLTDANFF